MNLLVCVTQKMAASPTKSSSSKASSSSAASKAEPKEWAMSEELKGLILHRQQIKSWLSDTNTRIRDLEAEYLDETSTHGHGNIIRGFEVDPRMLPVRRGVDDKEKLFSNSSYQYWLNKTIQENNDALDIANARKVGTKTTLANVETVSQASVKSHTKHHHKKHKKSSVGGIGSSKRDPIVGSFVEDWEIMDD
jgi:CCR4-NOT transcriptional regulation complex NOT5 subunit